MAYVLRWIIAVEGSNTWNKFNFFFINFQSSDDEDDAFDGDIPDQVLCADSPVVTNNKKKVC